MNTQIISLHKAANHWPQLSITVKTVCVSLMLYLGLAGSMYAQSVPDKKIVFAQTKAANDASLQGHVEKNAEKICRVYAKDAIILPPGQKPLTNAKEIAGYYTKGFAGGKTLQISTDTLAYHVIDPTHAQEVGSYTIHYQSAKDNTVTQLRGHYLIVWHRNSAGEWKIKWDMWQ